MKKLLICFGILISTVFAAAQNNYKDSLATEIKGLLKKPVSVGRDTSLNKTLNLFAREYAYSDPDSAIYYSTQALNFGKNAKWEPGIGISYHQLGMFAMNKGDYPASLNFLNQALTIWSRHENDRDPAIKANALKRKPRTLSNIGIVYDNTGEYVKSIEYYLKALKYYEHSGDRGGQATTFGNIGLVYNNLREYDKAMEYYHKAISIDTELKNYQGLGRHFGNLAMVYEEQKDYETALKNYFKALELKQEYGNQYDVAYTLGNIGNALANSAESKKNNESPQSLFDQALEYDKKALGILKEIGDKNGIARNMGNIGIIYHKQHKNRDAEKYLNDAIKICDEIGMLNEKMDFEIVLSDVYSDLGDHKKALDHYRFYSLAKDSIFNLEKDKELTSKQLNYEFEKKQAETAIKEQAEKDKIKAVANESEKKQQVIILSVAFVLLIVIGFSLSLYSRFKVTKKQKAEIEHQKELVDEKQKEIIDSITYAKRLQRAILATPENITRHIPENFLLYKPKDIVAGDFYFFETVGDNIFLGAADCTGHGVPGALVSIVCSNALSRCVKEFSMTDPGEILTKTRELVLETFKKSGEDVKDGMDISFCTLSKEATSTTLKWAGAFNPLWYTNAGVIEEIKANKQPIGLTEDPKAFTTHLVPINKGEMFFLFTDGYADQFGGEKGKKFKYVNLEKLLLANKDLSMQAQHDRLESSFENWRGNLEQIDDVCVIGVRIS